MRITYVARSFLDYRVPVLTELNRLAGGGLSFICSSKWTPRRALDRLKCALGNRALYLSGERSLGTDVPIEANTTVCLPYQPGLLRALGASRPNVVVGDGFFQWSYAALLRKLAHGTPLVICYERWAQTEKNAQWYRTLYRRLALRLTDAVCCNGKLSADYIRWLGFPAGRITTGHMAADTENLAARRALVPKEKIADLRQSWSAQGIVILCVGRLIPIKGHRELLNAWARFEQRHPGSATLVIVGGGPLDRTLRAQVASLRIHHVRFLGPLDYAELAPIYASADALAIATLEDNWSLVVPEAMACGLPILCSKYNGCWPELVQEDRNGWTFDPLQPLDTLRVLQQCLQRSRSGTLQQMGRESRIMLQNHTPQLAAKSIYEACELACARQPEPARTEPRPDAVQS